MPILSNFILAVLLQMNQTTDVGNLEIVHLLTLCSTNEEGNCKYIYRNAKLALMPILPILSICGKPVCIYSKNQMRFFGSPCLLSLNVT